MVYSTVYSQHFQQQRVNRNLQGPIVSTQAGQQHPWTHQSSRSFSAGSIYYPTRATSPSPSPSPSRAGVHPRSRSVSGVESLRSPSLPALHIGSANAPTSTVPDRYHRHRPSLRSSPSVKSFDFDSTSSAQTSQSSSTGSLPEDESKPANIQQVREILSRPATVPPSVSNASLQARSRSNSPTKTALRSNLPSVSGKVPATAFQPIQAKWAAPSPPPAPAHEEPVRRPVAKQPAKQAPLVLPSDVRVRHSTSLGSITDERRRSTYEVERPAERPASRMSRATSQPSTASAASAPSKAVQPVQRSQAAKRSPSMEALRGPPIVKPVFRPQSVYAHSQPLTPEVSPTSRREAETRSLPPQRVSRPPQPRGTAAETRVTATAPAPAPALRKSRSIGAKLRSFFGSKSEAARPAAPSAAAAAPAPVRRAAPAAHPARPASVLSSSQSMYEIKNTNAETASVSSVKSSMSTLSMSSMRRIFKRKDKKVAAAPSFEVLTPPMTREQQQQHQASQHAVYRHHQHSRSSASIDYAPRSYRNSMSANRPLSVASIGSLSTEPSKSPTPPVGTVANVHMRPVSMAFGEALSNVDDIEEFAVPTLTHPVGTASESSRPPTPLPMLTTKRALDSDEEEPDLVTASSTVFPRSLDKEGVANILSSLEVGHDGKLSRKSSRRSAKSPKEREEESVPNAEEIYVGTTTEELEKTLGAFSFPSALDSLELNHPAFKEPLAAAPAPPVPAPAAPAVRRRSRTTPRRAKVAFSSRIIVYDTYAESDYDRKPEEATCHRLSTPGLADQIRQELNSFKLQMEVHEQSRVYTHYFE